MSFPSQLEAMLEANRFAVRSGLVALIPGGPCGFWNGTFDLTYEGHLFRPNSLISVDEPASAMGFQADSFTITLPERSDFGITPDLLAQIETLDYKGRQVTVYDFYFDPDTRALVHAEPMLFGFIDTVAHVLTSGTSRLVARCETSALDNHRDGYRSASHEDQQLVSPGDMGFEHAAKTKAETFDLEL